MSDELLDRLSRNLRPVGGGVVLQRLVASLLAGGLVAFIGVFLLLGLRSDMHRAVFSEMFWVKLAYTGAIGAIGLWCIERLSRPAGDARRRVPWLLLPMAVLGLAATIQLVASPRSMRMPMLMGGSASLCPWLILATTTPLFAALVWALRGLAPTRLRLTGAVAGLTAGGAGASIYALHCPEHTAPFIVIWYSLGIVLAGAAGAFLGPRVLRW